MRRLPALDLIQVHLIIANDVNRQRRIELPESLREVVSKGIVIIDDQQHEVPALDRRTARWRIQPAVADTILSALRSVFNWHWTQ